MKAVIFCGYRHTVESPRVHHRDAELWCQSTSIRNWDWSIYDWSRWFDVHTVGPQAHYPGIAIQRPDVFAWYTRQGNERPIYMVETHPGIMGSVAYPRAAMEAAFGRGRFGCQLDYMGALALSEGFERWILYGIGQPYVATPTSSKAAKWLQFHRSFLWWLQRARAQGVEIVFDGPNMFTPELCGNEPVRETPMTGAYGYDMESDFEHYNTVQRDGFALTTR
jgi:hypothetical protein